MTDAPSETPTPSDTSEPSAPADATIPAEAPVEDSPPVPEPTPAPSPIAPISGIELWIGRSSALPLSHFLEATGAGHRGLCITREFPDRLKAYVGTRDVTVVWLTNVGRGTTVKPTDLPGIVALIGSALAERQVTALYLEGLEYLVRLHTIDRIVTVLLEIDASARAHDARLWIPVHPGLIPSSDLERLRTELPRTIAVD